MNKPLELPLLYGTIAYRMMLAHNSMRGFRTVWMTPDYKLEWVLVMSVAPSAPGPVN